MATFMSSKITTRPHTLYGKGIFAKEKILIGELLIDFELGTGVFISDQEADEQYRAGIDYMIQVDEDLFFATSDICDIEDADYINHSCNPNAGIRGRVQVVAMRDIEKDEEITFDYAMSESSDYIIDCRCGSSGCRQLITGNDWRSPILQKRYFGFFSKYLQDKISRIGFT